MIPQTGGSDASALLDVSPMSRMQISVLFIAVLLAMMDGFDLLGMAYVAPALSHAWGIGKGTLGFLLSTSLIGMALGSLALSPLADVTGRKPMVLSSIGLVVAGSLLSALCHAVPTLAACRVLTGIGIGTMVPLTTTIASEFANTTRRPFAIAATTVGLPAGSIVGALVAAVLLEHVGWPAVFVSGAIAGALLLPVIMLWLPESPSFLIARRPSDALERLNRILLRLDRPALSELPPEAASKRASYRSLFAPELIGITLRLGAVQILVSTTAYYFISWLPQVIADLGFPASTASLASAVSSVVGMISGLLFGFFAARFGPVRLASIAMIGFGLAIMAFGFTPPVLVMLILAAGACGVFLNGATGIFYATVSASFPPLSRASGIGFVIGIGRVFSISGPALAGWLFSTGLGRGAVSLIFGIAPILAGVLLIATARRPAPMVASEAG